MLSPPFFSAFNALCWATCSSNYIFYCVRGTLHTLNGWIAVMPCACAQCMAATYQMNKEYIGSCSIERCWYDGWMLLSLWLPNPQSRMNHQMNVAIELDWIRERGREREKKLMPKYKWIRQLSKTPFRSSYSCHLFYFRFHEDEKSYESRSRACFTLILPLFFFGIFRTIQLNLVQINSYIQFIYFGKRNSHNEHLPIMHQT